MRYLKSVLCILLLLNGVMLGQAASPQDPSQAELERAKLERDLAQAERDRVQAEADTMKAWIGTLSSTLPKGTTNVSGANIEASYIAYLSAAQAAEQIVGEVCPLKPSPMILYSAPADLEAMRALHLLRQQASVFDSEEEGFPKLFESVKLQPLKVIPTITAPLPSAAGPLGPTGDPVFEVQQPGPRTFAVVPVFAALDAVLTIASLFKVDTTITGATVPADEAAFQTLLARQMQEHCKSVVVIQTTYSFPPPRGRGACDDKVTFSSAPITCLLTKLQDYQDRLGRQALLLQVHAATPLSASVADISKLIGDADRKSLQEELKKLDQLQPRPSDYHKRREALENRLTALDNFPTYRDDLAAVQLRLDELKRASERITTLIATMTTNGSLQAFSRAESLNCLLLQNTEGCEAQIAEPWILVSKIAAIGGNNIVRQGTFHTALSFSGGIVASYSLHSPQGQIAKAGMAECYGSMKSKDYLPAKPGEEVSCHEASPKEARPGAAPGR